MNRLNYFRPYQSRPDHHEDQLTRAFLVVLRYSPLACAIFLETVREAQSQANCKHMLPSWLSTKADVDRFETQVSQIAWSEGILIPMILSDEKWSGEAQADRSERIARYDGVLYLTSGHVLIIENKPWSEAIYESQLSPGRDVDENMLIESKVSRISWRDVIQRISGLVERRWVTGAEQLIIEDFLTFVDEEHPYLNPYTTLGQCKNNRYLLSRRCESILLEIGPLSNRRHSGRHTFLGIDTGPIREVYLEPHTRDRQDSEKETLVDWKLGLIVYPGDSVAQAREFFNRVRWPDLVTLMEKGWRVRPNLHFSFAGTHLVWSEHESNIRSYFDYWSDQGFGRVLRNEQSFEDLFESLQSTDLINEEDVRELDEKFTKTNRNHIDICPGFEMYASWDDDRAMELDRDGRLVHEVWTKVQEMLQVTGQEVPTQ